MKKIFVFILSMMLIFSLCACVANKSQSPDLPSEDSSQGILEMKWICPMKSLLKSLAERILKMM